MGNTVANFLTIRLCRTQTTHTDSVQNYVPKKQSTSTRFSEAVPLSFPQKQSRSSLILGVHSKNGWKSLVVWLHAPLGDFDIYRASCKHGKQAHSKLECLGKTNQFEMQRQHRQNIAEIALWWNVTFWTTGNKTEGEPELMNLQCGCVWVRARTAPLDNQVNWIAKRDLNSERMAPVRTRLRRV